MKNIAILFICVSFTLNPALAVQLSPISSQSTTQKNLKATLLKKVRNQQQISELATKRSLQQLDFTVSEILKQKYSNQKNSAPTTSNTTASAPTITAPTTTPVTVAPAVAQTTPTTTAPVQNNTVTQPPTSGTTPTNTTPTVTPTPPVTPPPTVTPTPTPVVVKTPTPVTVTTVSQPVTVVNTANPVGTPITVTNTTTTVSTVQKSPTPVPSITISPATGSTTQPTVTQVPGNVLTAITNYNAGTITSTQLTTQVQGLGITSISGSPSAGGIKVDIGSNNLNDSQLQTLLLDIAKQIKNSDSGVKSTTGSPSTSSEKSVTQSNTVTNNTTDITAIKQAQQAALDAALEKLSKQIEEAQNAKKNAAVNTNNAITNTIPDATKNSVNQTTNQTLNNAVTTLTSGLGIAPSSGAAKAGTVVATPIVISNSQDLASLQKDLIKAVNLMNDPKTSINEKLSLGMQIAVIQGQIVSAAAKAGANMNQLTTVSSTSQSAINAAKSTEDAKAIQALIAKLEGMTQEKLIEMMKNNDATAEMLDKILQSMEQNTNRSNAQFTTAAASSGPTYAVAQIGNPDDDVPPKGSQAASVAAGFNPGGSTLSSGTTSTPIYQTSQTNLTNTLTIQNNPAPTKSPGSDKISK